MILGNASGKYQSSRAGWIHLIAVKAFLYDQWQWILLYVMLGFVMYWTSIVVQPTLDILEGQQETTDEIIKHQDNNTALLVELFDRQNKLLANQIMLVGKVANATQTFEQSSDNINEHVNTIIQQSNTIGEMIAYFRENFGERFIVNETAVERSTVDRILSNVTEFEGEIVLLREELRELIELLSNRTATTAMNLMLPIPTAMASDDNEKEQEQKDPVGDILEQEGIPRNPPEQDTTGQISSFDEGPVVVQSVSNETNATG